MADFTAWYRAPLMIIFAICLLGLKVVTIFPPGALVVIFAEMPETFEHSVPVYDPEWRSGNNTAYLADHTTIWYYDFDTDAASAGLMIDGGEW